MKNRILYGWSIRRAVYFVLGSLIIAYAIMIKEWWGALAGGYFAAMGLFGFGCAGGNCSYQPRQRRGTAPAEAVFEEIKAE